MSVTPLKLDLDPESLALPQEIDPSVDVLCMAGIDFEALGTHLININGSDLRFQDPNAGLVSLSQLLADDLVKVSANDTTSDYLFNKLVGDGGISITELNDGGNEQVQISIGQSGQYLALALVAQGNANNTWMSVSAAAINIDNTRLLLPYDSELIGLTFSCSTNNGDTDIEVYQNGLTITELVETFQVRASRYAWASNITPVPFSAGDLVAVYLRDQGTNIQNVSVILYFRISSETASSGSGNI